MLFGLLQFWLAQDMFGSIGLKPKKVDDASELGPDEPKLNPFTNLQLLIIALASFIGLAWMINDPVSKISEGAYNLFNFSLAGLPGSSFMILSVRVQLSLIV